MGSGNFRTGVGSGSFFFRILEGKESADKFLKRGIGILEMPQISQGMEWLFLLRLAVLLIELCLAVLKKEKSKTFH